MNPYLRRARERYEALRSSVEDLQTRAVTEDRDLTEAEQNTITEQSEQARSLFTEIETLTEEEQRHRSVAELAASLGTDADESGEQHRSTLGGGTPTGSTQTRDRDPGHYTRASNHSFFGDMHMSRQGDENAVRRLQEHNRALSTSGEGTGVVPPRWLTEEFETLARQGRRAAAAVRQIPLGDDPRPITLPRQTAGTDDVVDEQSSENDPVNDADAWDSSTTTVSPRPLSGAQIFSRQMLDMSTPAIDQLIFGDLISVYNEKVEARVVAAMIAAAGTPIRTYDDNDEWSAADDAERSDDVVDLAIAVRNGRKLPADILVMNVVRYGEFLKLKDSTGRPLMPMDSAGPMNVIGVGSPHVDGRIHGMGVIASDGVGVEPESIVAARAVDTILFESNMLRFRYEEPAGPESIRLGVWAYVAAHVKYAGTSTRRIVITEPEGNGGGG